MAYDRISSKVRFLFLFFVFASGYFKPVCFCIPNTKCCDFCSCGLNKLEVKFFWSGAYRTTSFIPNTGTQLILVNTQNLLLFIFLSVQTKERFLLVFPRCFEMLIRHIWYLGTTLQPRISYLLQLYNFLTTQKWENHI